MPKYQLLLVPFFHTYPWQGLAVAHVADMGHYMLYQGIQMSALPILLFFSRVLGNIFRRTHGEGGIYWERHPLLHRGLRKQEFAARLAPGRTILLSAVLEVKSDLKEKG